jgi:hypothetical protein
LAVCAIVGGVLFLSQLAEIPVRSALRGYDNTFNYLWLRSAMVDGDWDFRNDLAACDTLIPAYRASALALPPTPAGRIPNKYGVGWAVLSLPFYLLADGIVATARLLGISSLEHDGFNWVYQVCLQLGHGLLALGSLRLAARVVRDWLGTTSEFAWAGVIVVWAASPLLYYQTVNLSMSHGASFFAVALLAWGLARACAAPEVLWPWVVAGTGWGLATITRFQLVVFGLPLLWTLVRWRRIPSVSSLGGGARRWRAAMGVFLGASPLVALQLWAWHVVYGCWLVFSYGAEGESFHWTRPELIRSLFSSWHGLFYWHPFLLVAAVGAGGWAWRSEFSRAWLGAALLTVYLNAAWWCWWFASAFGGRAFDGALLPLMGGFAWLLQRSTPIWRGWLWRAAMAAGVWNFYLVTLYRTGAISRSEPVTVGTMLMALFHLGGALQF